MKKLLFATLVACGSPGPANVTITQPLAGPTTSVASPAVEPPDFRAFVGAGCTETGDKLDCTRASIDAISLCREPLYEEHVALDPPAAVAVCFVDRSKAENGVRQQGCMLPAWVHLFAATAKGMLHLASVKDFTDAFAPVTSGDEAIAFVTLLTGDVAYKEPFSPPGGARVSVAGPQVTRVTSGAGGFELRLFHGEVCGCSHPLSAVDYRVSRDGEVKELARTELWEDPKSMGMCVD